MKIIDNKKDYYDYLMGVLGQDELVVYDRRGSQMVNIGWYYVGYYPDWKHGNINLTYNIWIGDEYRVIEWSKTLNSWVCGPLENINKYRKPIARKTDKPIELIIVSNSENYCRRSITLVQVGNPILREIDIIRKHISPEFIWNNVYDFICKRKEKSFVDTRSDVQKAESHGFDKKVSFRHRK